MIDYPNPYWWHNQPSPTDKQIKFVEDMTEVLHIQFPLSSRDFTKYSYAKFISAHIDEFNKAKRDFEDPFDAEYYVFMGIDVHTPEDCY